MFWEQLCDTICASPRHSFSVDSSRIKLYRSVSRPEMQRVLNRLDDVPIDSVPEFVTARVLTVRYYPD
jgi:hypothetical protein